MKVVIDRDKCIGAAPCIAVAPGVFALDDEGKAIVLDEAKTDEEGNKITIKADVIDIETLKLAAESCPVQAIYVYDDDDKQVFPTA